MAEPLSKRIEAALESRPVVSTVADVYAHVIYVLRGELAKIEAEVWDLRNTAERYFDLRSRHIRLTEDIQIIESLADMQAGRHPEEKARPPRRLAGNGYGEP